MTKTATEIVEVIAENLILPIKTCRYVRAISAWNRLTSNQTEKWNNQA